MPAAVGGQVAGAREVSFAPGVAWSVHAGQCGQEEADDVVANVGVGEVEVTAASNFEVTQDYGVNRERDAFGPLAVEAAVPAPSVQCVGEDAPVPGVRLLKGACHVHGEARLIWG